MNLSPTSTLLTFLLFSFFQSTELQESPMPTDTDAFCAQAELHHQKMQADATYRVASQRMEEQP